MFIWSSATFLHVATFKYSLHIHGNSTAVKVPINLMVNI